MSKYISGLFGAKRTDGMPRATRHYKYKTRFAMLGTVGSGKSAVAAGIHLTAQTLSAMQPKFFCRVLEHTSNILADVSNLRRGRFPKKTNPYQPHPPESGLLVSWPGFLGEKKVQVPLADIAGEDWHQTIRQYRDLNPLDAATYKANINLINYVREADGYICVVPASRALMFQDDVQLERGSSELEVDPDVNLARILSAVIDYKEQSRGKDIKGIAVIITKWDLIAPYAENWGMDLYDPTGQGLQTFMDICFPATIMELKACGLDKVQFFPSHFQVLKNEDGTVRKWPDGSDRIDIIQNRRVPRYSEESYVKLFDWLRGFAS